MVDFSIRGKARGKTEGIDLQIIGNRANVWIPSVAQYSRWYYSPPEFTVIGKPQKPSQKLLPSGFVCWPSWQTEDAPTSFPESALGLTTRGFSLSAAQQSSLPTVATAFQYVAPVRMAEC
ncbi:hypothetical protein [Pseudomonas sp. MF6396]|uniref:hypothetical protein n=1 Tax=Pseudomonas sp. MF6396 TaxID=1960828 RepID=UPI00128FE70B|nr:hypothetical protein [Pseudomonas sp. MF6396]